jgi:hypothetical protein
MSSRGFQLPLRIPALLAILAIPLLFQAIGMAWGSPEDGTPDGRFPNWPDVKRFGKTTYRYVPSMGAYKITRPNTPTAFIHRDPGVTSTGVTDSDVEEPGSKASEEGLGRFLPTSELEPICRTGGNRVVFEYDGPDPVPVAAIRSIARRMNWKIADQSSKSSGGSRTLKMAVDCNSEGQISVYKYDENLNFGTGVFGQPTDGDSIKYLRLRPGSGTGSGSGTYFVDESKNRLNNNATRTGVGNVSGEWESTVVLHELFHTFGAVQPNAPFHNNDPGSSAHCADNYDVMCYPSEYYPCPDTSPVGFALDCNFDSYFDAAPVPGSYLATHWNAGGPENPFLAAMPVKAPKVTTGGTSAITSSSVTLSALVTPESEYAMFHFEYGPTTSYGSKSGKHGVQTIDGVASNVSLRVKGLAPNTTYHYRAVASNDAGQVVYGSDGGTFTTTGEPVVETKAVTGLEVKPSGGVAVLHGVVNPAGLPTTYQFEELGTGKLVPATPSSAGSGNAPVEVSTEVTGLHGSEIYFWRIIATNSKGTAKAENTASLTTPNWSATANTLEPVVLRPRVVDFRGIVKSGPFPTTYQFEYGTTKSYGSKVPVPPQSVGITPSTEVVNGATLLEGTTYHVRLAATNYDGTVYGVDRTFNTPKEEAPTVVTGPASGVGTESPTVTGEVNPNHGSITTVYVEYGTTTAYGSKVYVKDLPYGSTSVPITSVLTGLEPSNTYHFRLVAINPKGTTAGGDATFTTPDWSIQSTAEPSGAKSGHLVDVACPAAKECIGVGSYQDSSGTSVTLAERRSGSTKWTHQSTPNPSGATESRLESVSCTSTSACTAVGSYKNSSGTLVTLAERWNGTSWTIQSTPNPSGATESALRGVSCTSATHCTGVGYHKNSSGSTVTLALRWDGTTWTVQSTPNPAGNPPKKYLNDVSCISATDCWAAGESTGTVSEGTVALIERWNGTSWTLQSLSEPPVGLKGISCTSATHCTAVGGLTALRWNGTSWAKEAVATPPSGTLTAVSCTSASACTAVGSAVLVESWNGSAWSLEEATDPLDVYGSPNIGRFFGVSCTAANTCTAAGYRGPELVSGRKMLVEGHL